MIVGRPGLFWRLQKARRFNFVQEAKMVSKRWEEMEKDCLVKVFMKLGLDDLILNVPFVCKSWLAVAIDPLCWQKLDFRQIDVLPWSSFSKKFSILYSLPYFSFSHLLRLCLKRSCGSVTELRFPLKNTSLEELALASIECPKVKALALPILSPSEEVHLPELISKWKHLQKLEMESKPTNFTEMVKTIGLHCREFCGLTVSGTIGREDASAIVDHLRNIHFLDFSKSFLIREGLLAILNGCKGLERLHVDDCVGFDEDDREVLAMASAIKDFSNKRCRLYYEHVDEECDLGSGYYFCGFVL